MCWLHTTITPTHLWWLLARLLLGLGTRGYANQVPFYDQTTILIFFDNARRFFTVNPLGPFDRWLKQFTSMNRMEIFWLLSRRSSSFAASAGCFHLWWYPTLLGAHQVPQKRTCVCLFFPPSCVADMGGMIRAIRQTDRWQLTGATVRVKSQKEKKVCFSLLLWLIGLLLLFLRFLFLFCWFLSLLSMWLDRTRLPSRRNTRSLLGRKQPWNLTACT